LGALPVNATEQAAGTVRSTTYEYRAPSGTFYAMDVFGEMPAGPALRPAIVFFHGGGWAGGGKSQFIRQARILTLETKLIVISADYPINGNPIESTMAARAVVCWVTVHAKSLAIDLNHLALSGGSAGGQLAIAASIPNPVSAGECHDANPSPANMLILFNPVLDLSAFWKRKAQMPLEGVSPMVLVHDHALPPTLILQGTADTIAPVDVARTFVRLARAQGSKDIVLVEFDGRQHGFFNNKENGDLDATVNDLIKFMRKERWPIDR
jgi:acetyl esterase/lipase